MKRTPGAVSSFTSLMQVPPILQLMMGTAPHHDPVCHWRHVRVSSPSRGFPFRLGKRYGEQAPLMGAIQRLGSIVHARLALLAKGAPEQGPQWSWVTSRRGHYFPWRQ